MAVVGAILGKSDFIKKLNRMDVAKNRSQHQIKNGDVILTYLGMHYMGKPYFEAVHEMDDDKKFYQEFTLRAGYEITERRIDKYGQFFLVPEVGVKTWWTNLGSRD